MRAEAPSTSLRRHTSEFDVTLRTNSRGLREDESVVYDKAKDVTRILMVGDSFTLGYTVERADTLSQLLAARMRSEGRNVEVINGGTEGYSTDQEVLFLEQLAGEGIVESSSYDVVVLCMYQNDVWWNDQESYGPARKPRLEMKGDPPVADLAVPAIENSSASSWWKRTAIGSRFTALWTIDDTYLQGLEQVLERLREGKGDKASERMQRVFLERGFQMLEAVPEAKQRKAKS